MSGITEHLIERVRNDDGAAEDQIALPHPSWRSTGWMARNPWFERETLPVLRSRVAASLGDKDG